ncbi:unnamed protein product [Paramecium pentaurelia]|uniref:Uncharacterized protein n=1 Tax=Paramecium pentaurelia TaxID=43138 RepID=A0A8S1U0P9_9CILI|nr:unnamed protein product [Paramecium pentaurelia]
MSQSHLKCTCQSYRQTQTLREDPGLIEKLKERQMELEEKLMDFDHKKGNLERENLMLEDNIKLELQGLKENQVIQQQLTEELRDNKILTYKKQNELHILIQNVHENEAEKKQLMNEIEFLKQSLLHTNENQIQLGKKEEHIKLLLNRISELEQNITQLKREVQFK